MPTYNGTTGDDTTTGSAGDDIFIATDGTDNLDGAGGVDTLDFSVNVVGRPFSSFFTGVNLFHDSGTALRVRHGLNVEHTTFATGFEIFILTDFRDSFLFRETTDYTASMTIFAGDENDTIWSALGDDFLYGEAGDDRLRGHDGIDYFDGGDGIDTVDFLIFNLTTQGTVADLRTGLIANDGFGNSETMVNVENLTAGSILADILDGNDSDNTLRAFSTGDTLNGHGGNDRFEIDSAGNYDGGDGIDTLQYNVSGYSVADGAAGNGTDGRWDFIRNPGDIHFDLSTGQIIDDGFGNSGTITNIENLTINVGADFLDITVIGSDADNNISVFVDGAIEIHGGFGDDIISTESFSVIPGAGSILYGDAGSDTITGSANSDTLYGGTQNDVLDGWFGDDVMIGGTGNDIYFVDSAGDQVVELSGRGSGYDIVNTTLNTYLLDADSNIERINYEGTGNFLGRGDAGDNRFTGAAGNDRFLLDAGGADIFSGGSGRDSFDARTSTIGIQLHLEDQSLNAGDVAGDIFASMESFFGSDTAGDFMQTGAARARFSGFGGDDTLIGGASVDFLQGGDDNDTLFGNAARDTLQGGTGNDMMTGGADRDQFLFVEADFGQDTILDYEDGLDFIKVFRTVGDHISDFIIAGNGTDTVTLTLDDGTGNNILTLISHDGSNININAADFQFFG